MSKNSGIQTPKGTRDFYPEDQAVQNYLFDKWKAVCQRYGYEEYEGPMFEHLELFTGKSGDEIVGQLYHFQDKGGRDLSLRPEMTPTLARLVNQRNRELKKPFKWFSIPRLFRYERAQKGRLREFYQLNMDIMGTDSVYAEADLIAAIIALLLEFGLSNADFAVGISSRRLLVEYLAQTGVNTPDKVYPALDKRAKLSPQAFHKMLDEAEVSANQAKALDAFMACESLEELDKLCQSQGTQSALAELQELFRILKLTGLQSYFSLDLSVVRGLAYYTGIVFEVFDKAKSMRAIAGGGRYENLTARLGGEPITGIGFGMGDVVLKDLLEERGLLPADTRPGLDIWIVSFSGNMDLLFALGQELRQSGLSCSHMLSEQKVKKQLDAANRSGARFVLFADSESNTDSLVEIKDLHSGEQKTIPRKNLPELKEKNNE
jgi:histidyl-tRNA synthetase